MKRKFVAIGAVAAASALVVAGWAFAQGGGYGMGHGGGHGGGHGMGRGMGGHGPGHKGNPVRHRIVRHGAGVPKPYVGMKNPLAVTNANVEAGAKLYAAQCASCHGKTGEGDGDAGKGLNPKPANLAFIMDKWIATDGFLMWSMAEGGVTLKTDMPAFKDALSEKERWQIVTYLREKM